MYRLIATDLDGTLLDDSRNLPETNREYIRKAMECGVQVALCSGRSYISLAQFENMLGLNVPGCYGIAFNGGIVYDAHTKEIISDIRMNHATMLELVELLKRLAAPEIGICVYSGAELCTEKAVENIRAYADMSMLELRILDSYSEIEGDPSKIVLRGNNALLTEVFNAMSGFIEERCKMLFTASNLLEFIPLESGKGRGLHILAEKLGIPVSETIAVGDQVNDLDMIRAAGLGIAVANAVDEVKAAAGYTTQSDNNAGVFKEIAERFLGI